MSINLKESIKITDVINASLDQAEKNWNAVGLLLKAARLRTVDEAIEPSKIPGHPFVSDVKPKVSEFVVLIVDMRNSTMHMHTALKNTAVDQFQRVYYETSALLPALATAIEMHDGSVTEFLGDGVLSLFQASNPADKAIYAAYNAAEMCVTSVRKLLNKELEKRYALPPIDLGGGLAYGAAMVTLVGVEGNLHPKALGKCVYEASKLSAGINNIHVSESMKGAWPTSKGGPIKFVKTKIKEVDAFRVIS